MKYILLTASMLLAVAGQFLLKTGVTASSLAPNINSIIKTLFSLNVFLGLVVYGISSVVWLFVLQRFPLSVAYPALSLTYVVIVFLSYLVLSEPLNSLKLLGVVFIVCGVYFLFK